MIDYEAFKASLRESVPRFRANWLDSAQNIAVSATPSLPLLIVAGPGAGKTTVLVLRALRLVFVDGFLPEEVVLTTFTKKAADEIRTRLIEWGLLLIGALRARNDATLTEPLRRVDVNRFVTGTLDSICEDAIRTLRAPTDPAPVLLEGFAANAIMHRRGLTGRAYVNAAIEPSVGNYLAQFTFSQAAPFNVAELIGATRPLFDRFSHDLIDMSAYRALKPNASSRQLLADAHEAYVNELRDSNRLDFALLEAEFHRRLAGNRLTRFTQRVKALLVDEYQDTNLLQESIYFEIFRQTGASFTVVGDDDQSLYRFRGATVELFRDFSQRLSRAVAGSSAQRVDLVRNYRSTPEIVDYVNSFATTDPDFQGARIQPPKPPIQAVRPRSGFPVLGMFRDSPADLARDVSDFLTDVFRGSGRAVRGPGGNRNIVRAPNGGDFGDAVLLSHSVGEFTSGFMGSAPRQRLPGLLRAELAARGIGVFNPRGQELRDILDVQQLLGAILECLDPNGVTQQGMRLRGQAQQYLDDFRAAYRTFANGNPRPSTPHGLQAFVAAWGRRQSQGDERWPSEWPLLELCFKLLAWFPRLRDDPEGQIHLEAIARAIAQSASFSPYRSLILTDPTHGPRSVSSAIRDVLAPLAEKEIDLDEEIMPSVPRDRFAMMTIHQSKGLEFPLVIVDIASDFKGNYVKQRFKRFPETPSNVAVLEDDLAGACPIGGLRTQRTGIQRTFEDLIRLYYVAFSRPQTVLMLIGLDSCLQYATSIKHVATQWRRNESWAWIGPHAGRKKPPMANLIPLELL